MLNETAEKVMDLCKGSLTSGDLEMLKQLLESDDAPTAADNDLDLDPVAGDDIERVIRPVLEFSGKHTPEEIDKIIGLGKKLRTKAIGEDEPNPDLDLPRPGGKQRPADLGAMDARQVAAFEAEHGINPRRIRVDSYGDPLRRSFVQPREGEIEAFDRKHGIAKRQPPKVLG
jgi:hypothetical protein